MPATSSSPTLTEKGRAHIDNIIQQASRARALIESGELAAANSALWSICTQAGILRKGLATLEEAALVGNSSNKTIGPIVKSLRNEVFVLRYLHRKSSSNEGVFSTLQLAHTAADKRIGLWPELGYAIELFAVDELAPEPSP